MIHRPDKLNKIEQGFARASIVSITGLRQSGKTTLAKEYAGTCGEQSVHFDLEDPRSLSRFAEPILSLPFHLAEQAS